MPRITCPQCSAEYAIPDEQLGRRVKCGRPECGFAFLAELSRDVDWNISDFDDLAAEVAPPDTPVLMRRKVEKGVPGTHHTVKFRDEPWEKTSHIVVTTADLQQKYETIGPVYFQISNKGFFFDKFTEYSIAYSSLLDEVRSSGQIDKARDDWGFLWGERTAGQSDFDRAFFIAVEEIKLKAYRLGGNAVVGMRQDIDVDSTRYQYFYLQMYGTAVKLAE